MTTFHLSIVLSDCTCIWLYAALNVSHTHTHMEVLTATSWKQKDLCIFSVQMKFVVSSGARFMLIKRWRGGKERNTLEWQKHCQNRRGHPKRASSLHLRIGGSGVGNVWSFVNSSGRAAVIFMWAGIRGWGSLFMKLWGRSMIYEGPLEWSGPLQ